MAKINLEALLQAERVFSTKELAEVAQQMGWHHERTSGSHQIFSMEGWEENLSIPVNREYPWRVAKGFLYKIFAPARGRLPHLQSEIEKFENSLSQLLEQAEQRISAYETQKLEETELLLQDVVERSSIIQNLELRLQQTEAELHLQKEQAEAQKTNYEAQLHHGRSQSHQEIESFHQALHKAAAEQNALTQQVVQLRQERNRVKQTHAVERIVVGLGLGILSAIALGAVLTKFKFNCEPAQQSLSPPWEFQSQQSP